MKPFLIGYVFGDSCKIFQLQDSSFIEISPQCSSCKALLKERIDIQLFNKGGLASTIEQGTAAKAGIRYSMDTINVYYSDGNESSSEGPTKLQYNYYFNTEDTFPVKYHELFLFTDDYQEIECIVLKYSLKHELPITQYFSRFDEKRPTVLITELLQLFKNVFEN